MLCILFSSIGDSMGHCAGVTPEPDILDFDLLEERDDVVIMCTDGVWEFITPEEAVEIVSRYNIYQVRVSKENHSTGVLPVHGFHGEAEIDSGSRLITICPVRFRLKRQLKN